MRSTTAPVDLLARAIAWTCDALATAPTVDPCVPTPCHDWDLGRLLAHMSDGLDAFTEASSGLVAVPARPLTGGPVAGLCAKACALLEAWTTSTTDSVRVRDLDLAADVLLHTAALEITVHGWDVARACHLDHPMPVDLAADLVPAAMLLVTSTDRPGRFDPPLPGRYDVPSAALLAHLGRHP